MRRPSGAGRNLLSGLILFLLAGCGDHELIVGPKEFSSYRVWHVPGEVPTIQEAIFLAAAGDTVVVAPGVYSGCSYKDPTGRPCSVIMKSGICLRSETGNPDCATLDAGAVGRVIYCGDSDGAITIEGFTITGGFTCDWKAPPTPDMLGGGVHCVRSSLNLLNCVITGNTAGIGGGVYCESSLLTLDNCEILENRARYYDGGGGMYCKSSSLVMTRCVFARNRTFAGGGLTVSKSLSATLTDCIFEDNRASYGGGVYCVESIASLDSCTFSGNWGFDCGGGVCFGSCSPTLRHCTFVGNAADEGGGIYCDVGSPVLMNTLIAFNTGGGAVFCEDDESIPSFACCNLHGNVGGNWTAFIADQAQGAGNLSDDPLLCFGKEGDFHLQPGSPCAHAEGCGQIGAWGVGCPDR